MTEEKPQTIALNKKAKHDYTLEETFEAGLMLDGWEVKSLRAGKAQITETYVIIKRGEAWMVGAHISPLKTASTHITPDPIRTRKLLLHKAELSKLIGKIERKGYSLLVTRLYWKRGKVKAALALGKGKKTHDKRAAQKEKDWQRDKQRNFKER